MMNSAAFELSAARLEYDEQSLSTCLADRRANVGGVFRNSYDVEHSVASRVENVISMIGLQALSESFLFNR